MRIVRAACADASDVEQQARIAEVVKRAHQSGTRRFRQIRGKPNYRLCKLRTIGAASHDGIRDDDIEAERFDLPLERGVEIVDDDTVHERAIVAGDFEGRHFASHLAQNLGGGSLYCLAADDGRDCNDWCFALRDPFADPI